MMYKYTNKKIFFNKYIFIIVSFVIPSFVFANVSIIEIMYDPKDTDASAGGEWIEIYNNGSAPLDLTTWLFFEANTNHGITADGISLVPPGGYAVISRDLTAFKNFFTEFSGLLFKASFSLNDGEKLAVKSDKEAIPSDEVTYTTEWGEKRRKFSPKDKRHLGGRRANTRDLFRFRFSGNGRFRFRLGRIVLWRHGRTIFRLFGCYTNHLG